MVAEQISSVSEFRTSLSGSEPPAGLNPPLAALWWAASDDWDKAHGFVQGHDDQEAAWVHAYLHRVEGDLSNAAYWYRRAGRDPSTAPLDREWAEILAALVEG